MWKSLSVRYVNNRCFISKILLVCCVHSLDFRYRELVRKYHTDRLCMKYSISISFVLIDIDECLNRSHACDVNANCTNTDGSYNCTCKEGYTGDGQSCQGILDQTVHHTGLLLTLPRACPKFTNTAFIEKLAHCLWKISEKSESSLHKRRSLRNCEKGMEFLTCDGCEDEYNK